MNRKMKKYLFYLLWLVAGCTSDYQIETEQKQVKLTPIQDDVCPDINCFNNKMISKGVATQSQLEYFFNRVNYKDSIIRVMNKPGTSNPWYIFKKNNVSSITIRQGINFYNKNKLVINTVSKKTGVPPEYILAILGMETRYGMMMGHENVADSLYTLAFYYPRRARLFQKELEEFFLMSQEANRDPFTYKGSFAGAMGYPQFMPSSYRKWAVSYSGNDFPDIWHKEEDAIASIGNYLQQHGWQRGEGVYYPVSLNINPQLQTIITEETSLKYSVGDLKSKGVNFFNKLPDNLKVVLFKLETSPGSDSYFVGLNNFYTIWKYNNSHLYVMAIEQIAQGIRKGIY
ncbi:MAG: lytic murein transglycosylase B [Neisseriaceae bacterium]|nr:MAG: lytic murein transglycosylase B [Neisseriaceae bacterium]